MKNNVSLPMSEDDVYLSDEVAAVIDHKIEEAERDIEEMRFQIRWGKSQVEIVREAATLMGVPYQTYTKMVLLRQAVADIEALGRAARASKKRKK